MKMILFAATIALVISAGTNLLAEPGAPPAPGGSPAATATPAHKSQFNTHVYQKEKSEKSFTAKVKILRELPENWDVVFEGQPGSYAVDEGSQALTMLGEAQKSKKAVMVRVNEDTSRVLSVGVSP